MVRLLAAVASPRSRVLLAVLLALMLGSACALLANPVGPRDAEAAVRSWLIADSRPLNASMKYDISGVQSFVNPSGEIIYYVVSLNPSGYVVVAADDSVEPIISFSAEGSYDASPASPIFAMVNIDLARRTAEVRNGVSAAMPTAALAALPTKIDTARSKWSRLLNPTATMTALSSISDVRVAPLVQSRWDQKTAPETFLALYNYYTPPGAAGSASNYVCGCVATSMSQLMRYFQYPTAGVGTSSFTIKVSGATQSRATRGGDGKGGAYNWSAMPLVPDYSISSAQRQAIGALCSDAGVTVHMEYDTDSVGSGAIPGNIAPALRQTFKYANAISYHPYSEIGAEVNGMLNASLDFGSPVLLAIYGDGGHSIICDGYGMNLGTQYHHLNMGWSGACDAWYNLPTIQTDYYTFTEVGGCVYNVFPSGTGEIISGRVTDGAGNPISGVTVTATPGSGSPITAVTSARGVYAMKVASSTQYSVLPQAENRVFVAKIVTTGRSRDEGACGNRWGTDFQDGSGGGNQVGVTAFAINNGGSSTFSRTITLNNQCTGSPTWYQASEDPTFSDSIWIQYSTGPSFTLSPGAGIKTVYFRVKNDSGSESSTVSDTIELSAPQVLTVNGPDVTGTISTSGDADWYQFTAAGAGLYTIETKAGTLLDNVMYLYDSDSNELASDDDSGEGNAALISYNITEPGLYLIKVRAYSSSNTGTYAISVKNNSACAVTLFNINNGAQSTVSPDVTLNNSCTGAPAYYMASEHFNFSDASWTPYSTAPAFTLSSGEGVKTVYFKVKTASGTVSQVVSDTIAVGAPSMTELVLDGPALTGNIASRGAADWYRFTISVSGRYTIETRAGSLTDNYMEIYGPDSTTALLAYDDDSGDGYAAMTSLDLEPGVYYAKVRAYSSDGRGTYTISLTGSQSVSVSSMSINNGDDVTLERKVTLNNSCYGTPVSYMASEQADFSDASWQPYSAAPEFTLSEGNDTKTVYFKVKTSGGRESDSVSDTIDLVEFSKLVVDGPQLTGNINPAGDVDLYMMEISVADTYTIETRVGTLTDTCMVLDDSDGNQIAYDDDSGVGNAAKIVQYLEPGMYYLGVGGFNNLSGNYTISVRSSSGLAVNTFAVNAGARTTATTSVVLNNTVQGTASKYMASELPDFQDASWRTYAKAPTFTLSSGNGRKTIYFKVATAAGKESPVVSDEIMLQEAIPLTINAPAISGGVHEPGDTQWFSFVVTSRGRYTISTWAGTLSDTYMELYGPNDQTILIAHDDNSGDGNAARIAYIDLAAGTYYVKVRAYSSSETGDYTIRVTSGALVEVTSLLVNNGAGSTQIRNVNLRATCSGTPSQYMASESSDFVGAAWVRYAASVAFTLSAGNGSKTIYYKVKTSNGTQSPVVRTAIDLTEPTALTLNAPTTEGAIDPAGEFDWYQFAVTKRGSYTIETVAGSLTDTYMELYSVTGSQMNLVQSDDDGGDGSMSKIVRNLSTGLYYVRIRAYSGSVVGTYGIGVRGGTAPSITSLAIDGGAESTADATVRLNNVCIGSPTAYMASESSTFSGASWRAYSTAPVFTLSAGNGVKTVYFKVRGSDGTASPVVTDTILLAEPAAVEVPVDGVPVDGNVPEVMSTQWYTFTITTAGQYTVQTIAGTLSDSYIELYGSNRLGRIIESDDDDGDGYMSRITRTLSPGVYFVNVRAYGSNATGTYGVQVKSGAGCGVTSLTINGGAETTASTNVTLATETYGGAIYYQASESPTLAGASWRPYAKAVGFKLSSRVGAKTIYFRVKDAAGGISQAASATITYAK